MPEHLMRRRLDERLRAEYIAHAEEEWRKRTGRPMTTEELERVLRRYPGTCEVTSTEVGNRCQIKAMPAMRRP
jgi:hypothetical protein